VKGNRTFERFWSKWVCLCVKGKEHLKGSVFVGLVCVTERKLKHSYGSRNLNHVTEPFKCVLRHH
jgi:hypothetical protein